MIKITTISIAIILGVMIFVGSLSLHTYAQNVIKTVGSPGSGNGQLNDPRGLVVDNKGNLYVVDSGNDRIQEFESNGKLIRTWGSFSTGNGQFNAPIGIDEDEAKQNVYVTDVGNNRVERFTSNGLFVPSGGLLVQVLDSSIIPGVLL